MLILFNWIDMENEISTWRLYSRDDELCNIYAEMQAFYTTIMAPSWTDSTHSTLVF